MRILPRTQDNSPVSARSFDYLDRTGRDYYDLFNFELKVVELGRDEDGDPITSTVVREVALEPESTLTVVKLKNTPIRVAVRGVLCDARRAMSFEELVTAAVARLAPPEPGKDDNRRKRIRQAFERMLPDRELYVDESGMVSLLNPAILFTPVPETMTQQNTTHERNSTDLT